MHYCNSEDIKICKEITRKAGKTYYFAIQLFPKSIREATYGLYAFYRVPDDIVDLNEDLSIQAKTNLLNEWIKKWQDCLERKGQSDEAVLRVAYQVHLKYEIDFSYSYDFFKAMQQDLTKSRYESYSELEKYMYGSAAVVGIMMTHLVGKNKSEEVFNLATKLGYAMQLTNFLRDIKEDIDDRDRIYMPSSEYKNFEIEELDFIKHRYPENWANFMELQLHRAERLYRESEQGFKYLKWYAKIAIKVASRLYENYHKQIRNSDYKVFHSNYKVPKLKRLYILLKSLFI